MTTTPVAETTADGGGERPSARFRHGVPRPEVLAVVATAVCAALVAFRLGDHSFWFDEGATMGTVDRSVGDALWRIYHWELNQSPFEALMIGWQHVGNSDAALRALPAMFAVLCVPVAYLVGVRLRGRVVGGIAAALLAVHPLLIQWGQQLRGYSLVVLLLLAATLLLVRAVERPTAGWIVAYTVVAALAIYTQFFAGWVIAAHALSLLVVRPLPRRLLVGAGALGAVLLAPLLEYLVNRNGDPLYWVEEPTRAQIMGTARVVAGGGATQLVVYALVVLVGLVVVANELWSRPVAPSGSDEAPPATESLRRWGLLLPVLMLVVPPAGTLAVSFLAKPLTEGRFLIVMLPGLVLVAAIGLAALPRSVAVAGLLVVVAASALGLRDWYERPPFQQWREAVATVAASATPDDLVVTAPGRAVHVVRHYADVQHLDAEVGYPDPAELAALADGREETPGVVYELVRDDLVDVTWDLPPAFRAWLDQRYVLVDQQDFAGLVLRRYAPAP